LVNRTRHDNRVVGGQVDPQQLGPTPETGLVDRVGAEQVIQQFASDGPFGGRYGATHQQQQRSYLCAALQGAQL